MNLLAVAWPVSLVVLASCNASTPITAPLSPAPTPVQGSVRLIYATPKDIPARDTVREGIGRAANTLQAWYRDQLGGKSFVLNAAPVETCVLPKASKDYFKNTRDLVIGDLRSACAPVQYNDPNFIWVIYADVDEECNANTRLGVGASGLAIMGRMDVLGLEGQSSVSAPCDGPYTFPFERWIGGMGHELGHALGLPHPPGCDSNQLSCDSKALMWAGFYDFPNTYFRDDDKATLLKNPFIR
jgi:hypothetical protein